MHLETPPAFPSTTSASNRAARRRSLPALRGAWLGLLPLAACTYGRDVEPPLPLTDAEVTAIRQAVADNLGNGLATSYSVAIWRDGAVLYREAFGARDPEGTPVTADTLFQIGSDTKKITAIALLQQVDAHAFELDQPVSELLPELQLAHAPGLLEAVSTRDLLRQYTGLYDYTPWSEAPEDAALAQIALGRFAQNEYTILPPNAAWSYSNPNYSLAGLLVEHLTGRPWADVVASDVCEPLGMQHSYGRRDDALRAQEDLAWGQGRDKPGGSDSFALLDDLDLGMGWVAPEAQFDNAFTRPAGLVWSTAADQARLLGFLADGKASVLSQEMRRYLLTKQGAVAPHSEDTGYSAGLFVTDGFGAGENVYYAVPTLVHGGNTWTMTSSSVCLPEQRVAVSVLANGDEEDLSGLMARLLIIAGGERLPPPRPAPERPAPLADQQSYAGTYTDPNLGEVTLRWQDGQLQIEVPLLDALEVPYASVLQPVQQDVFLWSVDDYPESFSFYDSPEGQPHAYGVGDEFALQRVPAPASALTP